MALEGVELNPGTGGAMVATDTVGGFDFQVVKLAVGADGSADLVDAAHPIQVEQQGTVTVDGTVGISGTVTVDASGAAVPVTDNGSTLSVDDGGGVITVDGTVAVTNAGLTELAAAINGSSQMDVNIAASGATVPVSNAGLTELAAAINASSQMDVNIAASGATVPVSNAGLTELAAAINGSSQMDVNLAASNATVTVASHHVTNAGTFAVQVSGNTAAPDVLRISVQSSGLTTAATAYTAGDQVGAQFTFANASRASDGYGYIVGCTLISAADIIGAYDVVVTRASITLASDNAAYSISDSDALQVVGIIQLTGAFDIGANRVAQAQNLRIPYDCSGGTSLYAGLITRSGHTFFGAATDLQLILHVERQ